MADWSEQEVDLIVADYFRMLHEEINGRHYNKTAHRNYLLPLLNERSEGSVERKHQNISAVLIKYGLPYIFGYKPLSAYQKLLEQKVLDYLARDRKTELDFRSFASQEIKYPVGKVAYAKWEQKPPSSNIVSEPAAPYFKARKPNYLEQEQRNRSIGFVGEELAFEYEKWRLNTAGLYTLAKEVKWVSRDEGDGAGYDILSKTTDGSDIFIEVKTTTLGKDTPIFFSKNENEFSKENRDAFHLYRVFDVKKDPRLFQKKGAFADMCTVEAVGFKGMF